MKTFIGVKIVQAEPCTLGAYNTRRGWQIPENEDPQRAGFYLEYPDGYKSWSPAEIFRGAYRLISDDERALVQTTKRPVTFYDRLLAESQELEDRKEKLAVFINSNAAFIALPIEQQNLMRQQFDAMQTYAMVLGQRIASVKAPDPDFPIEGEIKVTGGNHAETPVPFKGDE